MLGKRRRRGPLWMLFVISALAAVSLMPAAGDATVRTRAIIYHAFDNAGKPTMHVTGHFHGSCFSGSLAANRNDAWRCMSGNTIADPCFSSSHDPGVVLCPQAPGSTRGIQIKVSKFRFGNKHRPSTSGLPWGIQTLSGTQCAFASGATNAIGNNRANYACRRSSDWLWGSPSRRTEPWTILAAPISAKSLHRRVAIRIAWF